MKSISFLVALFLLSYQVKVSLGKMAADIEFEELRFSNVTENSFFDFTDFKFKKINRTHRAMTGIWEIRKEIQEETDLQVLIILIESFSEFNWILF